MRWWDGGFVSIEGISRRSHDWFIWEDGQFLRLRLGCFLPEVSVYPMSDISRIGFRNCAHLSSDEGTTASGVEVIV